MPLSPKQNIYIIVPAFNEANYIVRVIEKIKEYSDKIIVVDDGSSDDTFMLAKPHVKLTLRHEINLGKGAALKTGCEYAFKHQNADAVIFIDSDDQHDPKHIPEFVKQLQLGNDLVFGIRKFTQNMPRVKVFANAFASLLIKFLFGRYIPDIPSGYKALSKKAYRQIYWNASDYGVELEIAVRTAKYNLPFSIVPIDTVYHDHERGMTIIDAIKITGKLIEWRLTI